MTDTVSPETRRITANGITQQFTVTGVGHAILMLHGWPLTSHTWRHVTPLLVAAGYRTIAPDLRGIGGSARPLAGYDVETVAEDAVALLDALNVRQAFVVGIDLGTPVAWMLAMRHPDRVCRLAVMEGLLGRQPGAEQFLGTGTPWWFGFHSVPGLAERLLGGREADYLDWFLAARAPDHPGVEPAARAFYAKAYAGPDALRGGFEHYRAMPDSARQIAAAIEARRLTVPTLAVSGGVIGDALWQQLQSHADNLRSRHIEHCSHNIPEEQPAVLANVLLEFFAEIPTQVS